LNNSSFSIEDEKVNHTQASIALWWFYLK